MIMHGQSEEYREVVSVKMLQGPLARVFFCARLSKIGSNKKNVIISEGYINVDDGFWRQNLLMTNTDVGTNTQICNKTDMHMR